MTTPGRDELDHLKGIELRLGRALEALDHAPVYVGKPDAVGASVYCGDLYLRIYSDQAGQLGLRSKSIPSEHECEMHPTALGPPPPAVRDLTIPAYFDSRSPLLVRRVPGPGLEEPVFGTIMLRELAWLCGDCAAWKQRDEIASATGTLNRNLSLASEVAVCPHLLGDRLPLATACAQCPDSCRIRCVSCSRSHGTSMHARSPRSSGCELCGEAPYVPTVQPAAILFQRQVHVAGNSETGSLQFPFLVWAINVESRRCRDHLREP